MVEAVGDSVTSVKPSVTTSCCRRSATAARASTATRVGRRCAGRRSAGGRQPFTWRGEPAYSFANASVLLRAHGREGQPGVPIPKDVPLDVGGAGRMRRAHRRRRGAAAGAGAGGCERRGHRRRRHRAQRHPGCGARGCVARSSRSTPTRQGARSRCSSARPTSSSSTDAVRGACARQASTSPSSASATSELIRAAIDLLDWGGTCVMLGVPESTAEASFNVASMYLDKACWAAATGRRSRSATCAATSTSTAGPAEARRAGVGDVSARRT